MTAHHRVRRGGARSFRLPAQFVLGAIAAVLLAACSGTSGPSWTLAPITPVPSTGAVAPSASGSPAAGSPATTGAPASPAPAGSGAAPSSGPASPAASEGPAAGSPAASAAAGTTIDLEETEGLTLLQNGQPVNKLDVKVGDTITFVIHNTADFDHTFYIGPADALKNDQTAGLPGLGDFQGTQQFTYTVTADTANLQFGCSLEGHYDTMHGDLAVTP